MDVNRKNDYLRNKEGNIVDDCNGSSLSKDGSWTEAFWDKNNLPHRTVYFKCVGGKAYLSKNSLNNHIRKILRGNIDVWV